MGKINIETNNDKDENVFIGFIDFLFQKFEVFIVRAILPSVVFLFLMFLVDATNHHLVFESIINLTHNYSFVFDKPKQLLTVNIANKQFDLWFIIISIILLLSISYILKFLSQLIFDNLIKTDYDPFILKFYKKEDEGFKFLREKVLEKLSSEYHFDTSNIQENDYILYQILGRLIKVDTKRYVTDAKEAGIIIVSAMIVIGWYMYLHHNYWHIVTIILVWYIGLTYEKVKYRSRAYRMYVNFLLDKEGEKNEEAK